MPKKDLVRRSNLLVPMTASRPLAVLLEEGSDGSKAWRRVPDALTLDLEDGVPAAHKAEARAMAREAITQAGSLASQVFVRINVPYLHADLEASVWPGLAGIVLPQAENARDVAQASQALGDLERSRGIEVGSLEIVVLVESALGVWNVAEIIAASPRVTQVGLDEEDMCRDLGILPVPDYDPLAYARGRLVIEGTSAGRQPLGTAHPLGCLHGPIPRDELLRLLTVVKDLGFKGAIFREPSWVEAANAAFAPEPRLVEYYTQVREVFAQAVEAGTAAVPFMGRMIDVPVDEWAKVVLHQAALCHARDEEKRRALEGMG